MRQFQINESHSVSGRRESNPHQRLGKPLYYHCTTTAKIFISLLLPLYYDREDIHQFTPEADRIQAS